MAVKPRHRIFFAIPFDTATSSLYGEVGSKLQAVYPDLDIVVGNQQIGPSKPYSDMATFKAQNVDLFRQFVGEIRAADIVVADLTHGNPNVHVELGIALDLNKNILRVTGRSLTELGFDIRGFEAYPYRNINDLTDKIRGYLETFLEIKRLPLAPGQFYREYHLGELDAFRSETRPWQYKRLDDYQRDGAIQVRFNFLDAVSPDDWFGVYVRASYLHPWMYSCLVYVRKKGWLEVAMYPWRGGVQRVSCPVGPVADEVSLLVEIEGNVVRGRTDHAEVVYDELALQQPGFLGLGCWNSRVSLRNIQIVQRDTIEFETPPD